MNEISGLYHVEQVQRLTSLVAIDANARIKPARAASIDGVRIVTKAARPTMTDERRLKRTESHLLTA
jgi:hypothetical protein